MENQLERLVTLETILRYLSDAKTANALALIRKAVVG